MAFINHKHELLPLYVCTNISKYFLLILRLIWFDAHVPFESILPTPPNNVGNNAASAIDLKICVNMMIGSNSFFKPNAKNPNPNPVKNEFLPKFNLAVIQKKFIVKTIVCTLYIWKIIYRSNYFLYSISSIMKKNLTIPKHFHRYYKQRFQVWLFISCYFALLIYYFGFISFPNKNQNYF